MGECLGRATPCEAEFCPQCADVGGEGRRRCDAAWASWGLAAKSVGDSAAFGLTQGQRLSIVSLMAVLALAAVLEPIWLLRAVSVAAWTLMICLSAFRLALIFTPVRGAKLPSAAPLEQPRYSVLAPLYDEAEVVADLVESLGRLDYPSSKLDIQLIVEADDGATRRAAIQAVTDAGPHFHVTIVPPGAPRTKPRALNFALSRAQGEYVVVYDAEDRPAAEQLNAALGAFDEGGERLAAVQAPLAWWNARENLLTRQFALEYAFQFHVVLPALARWGWALPLGGTSNHFRRAALEAVGGWDPHNVTEDADLGFRLAAYGWRVGVIFPRTAEEAVTSLCAWTKQRSRWFKGFVQTWFVRMRCIGQLRQVAGWGAVTSLQLTVAAPVIAGLAHGVLAGWTMAMALRYAVTGHWPLAFWDAAIVAGSLGVSALALAVGAIRSRQFGVIPDIALAPFYWTLQTPAVLRAFWQLFRAPFHWDKTRHGVAKSKSLPPTSWPAAPIQSEQGPDHVDGDVRAVTATSAGSARQPGSERWRTAPPPQ